MPYYMGGCRTNATMNGGPEENGSSGDALASHRLGHVWRRGEEGGDTPFSNAFIRSHLHQALYLVLLVKTVMAMQ